MTWDSSWFDGTVAVRTMLAWRGVEAQHVVSTLRLVDTPQEQDLLEQLLEASKPPTPSSAPAPARPKHYLLTTPFRYHPVHASRFRPARARGQWYGGASLFAACAEVAHWRHQFLMDSEGLQAQVLLTEHSFFKARVRGRAVDLTAQPWLQNRAAWVHPNDYSATQAVAAAAQARDVQWLRYESARAPGHACAVVFEANCLSEPKPSLDSTLQTWRCKTTQHSVLFAGPESSFVWAF